MNKFDIINKITRTAHKVGFQLKKHSPEILAVAGTVGVVVSGVLACKATLKVHEVTEPAKKDIEAIHEAAEKGITVNGEEYTEQDMKKDLVTVYAKTSGSLIKLYAPAVGIGLLSLASILTSNNILRKRNVALAAAYTMVDKGFKEYRGRVIERFGKELDTELLLDVKAKKIKETIIDENGEEKDVERTVYVSNPSSRYSEYARCFDVGCKGWEKDPEYNLMFLRQTESYMNDLLRSRGHVVLNDVYDQLGIPRSKAGAMVGWVYNEEKPTGDNYIDFGIYNIHDEQSVDFVNGYERSIWLDFNVDGYILDLI